MNKNKVEEVKRREFIFCQIGEFDDPIYIYLLDGEMSGHITYMRGRWRGNLKDGYVYSSSILKEMAKKIDELNNNLKKERSKFFGL